MKRNEKKRAKKPITMRRVRFVSALLSIVSCIFVFSYGFANWSQVVVLGSGTVRSGMIKAYGVLSIDPGQPKLFSFAASTFLTDQGASCDTGTITVPCTVGVATCKTAFTVEEWATGKMKMTVTLGYENLVNVDFAEGYGLFVKNGTDAGKLPITASIQKPDGSTVTPTFVQDATKLVVEYTIPCSELPDAENATYNVIFTISLPVDEGENAANFRQNLGKYLSVKEDAPSKFVATAELEKVK